MKILVTGGAGAVGSNLIPKLLEEGHKVISWDNYSAGTTNFHVHGATYKNIDTNMSYDAMEPDFDLVYHLGEYSKIVPSFNEIKTVFDYNITGTFKLIEMCKEYNIPIVYAASSTRLSNEGELQSPYSFFKSTTTKLIQGYGNWFGLKYNICYFYNVYGPGTEVWGNEWQTVINIFINQKKKNIPLTVTGDGTQTRDFTHVADIVQGLMLAGKNICNSEFQLGSGIERSVLDVAKMFNHPIEFVSPRPGDRSSGLADISSAKNILGYTPRYNLSEYINEQMRKV